jgi:hypothetical protein
MRPLTDFYPRILPYAPGCPEVFAAQALVDGAIQFCEESLVLRERQDAFTSQANVASYDVAAPTYQQVARIINVWINGTKIQPAASEDVGVVDSPSPTTPSTYYTLRGDGTFSLVLYPTPDAAYSVIVEVAYRPQRGALQLQNDLYDLWLDPVTSHAMARVLSVPGVPWSDPQTGAAYKMQAATATRRARIEGAFGRVQSSLSVSNNSFV